MQTLIAILIGFGTLCPVLLSSEIYVRLSDMVALILDGAAAVAVLRSWPPVRSLAAYDIAIILFTLGWVGAEATYTTYLPHNPAATMILVRWVVAIPAAIYLGALCEDPVFRKYLSLGAVLGCAVTIALLILDYVMFQAAGYSAFTPDMPGATFVNGNYRAFGIFGHPNGAAIGTLLFVPFFIGAAAEFGWHRWVLFIVLPVNAAVFYVTETRGAMLVSLLLLTVWGWTRRPGLTLWAVFSVCAAIGLIYIVDPTTLLPNFAGKDLFSELVTRFTDELALENNASGRMDTTLNSLEIAFEHPFGMGSTYEAPLDRATGFAATHNGLAQLGLLGGMPLAILVTVLLIRTAVRVLSPARQTYHWVALYLLIVSMFESVMFLPFFSTLLLWVIACSRIQQPEAAPFAMDQDQQGATPAVR